MWWQHLRSYSLKFQVDGIILLNISIITVLYITFSECVYLRPKVYPLTDISPPPPTPNSRQPTTFYYGPDFKWQDWLVSGWVPIHPMTGTYVAFISSLLWIMPQWTWTWRCHSETLILFPSNIYSQMANHMVVSLFIFEETLYFFP